MALLATIAVVVVRRTTPVELGFAQGGDLRGVLVYTARDGEGWRLYRWDLPTWTFTPGPALAERPIELVHALDATTGAIGMIQVGDAGQAARILRHLDERDRATTLLRGQLVAWSPGGATAVAAVQVDTGSECPDLVVRASTVDRATDEVVVRQPLCGSVAAIGRTSSTTFVTIAEERRWTTFGAGPPGFATLLRGWGLVGVSRGGTQLVIPADTEAPPPLARFSGNEGEPTPYGVGVARLGFEALLGWARAASGGYVLGTYEQQRGIYLASVDTGGAVRFAPALVVPLPEGDPTLTETDAGVPLLALDGRFYRVRDGSLHGLEPPEGAPAPEGPILWIPAVPDST